MSKQKITIIDTGVANLSSVYFAMQRLDADCIISAEATDIRNADKLILPGVGSAVAAMAAIRERHLDELIREVKQPLLGICLGMQMLAAESEESMNDGAAKVDCLGLVDGRVRLMQVPGLVLPHMGWDQVEHDGSCPLFKDIPSGAYFYYVPRTFVNSKVRLRPIRMGEHIFFTNHRSALPNALNRAST